MIRRAHLADGTLLLEGKDLQLSAIRAAVEARFEGPDRKRQLLGVYVTDARGSWRPFRTDLDAIG